MTAGRQQVSLARIAQVFTTVGDRNSLERLFKLVVVSIGLTTEWTPAKFG